MTHSIWSVCLFKFFCIISGKFRPEGQLSRGTFMLDETQISLCIKTQILHELKKKKKTLLLCKLFVKIFFFSQYFGNFGNYYYFFFSRTTKNAICLLILALLSSNFFSSLGRLRINNDQFSLLCNCLLQEMLILMRISRALNPLRSARQVT